MNKKKSRSSRRHPEAPLENLLPSLLVHSLALAAMCAAIYAALVETRVAPLVTGAVLVTLMEAAWGYFAARR